jgi:hypothetical protein
MSAITKEQIKRIYALGSAIGIVDRGNKDDDLHTLVSGMTGKDSVSDLTGEEFIKVERELLNRMRVVNHNKPYTKKPSSAASGGSFPQGKPNEKPSVAGMMTKNSRARHGGLYTGSASWMTARPRPESVCAGLSRKR